MVTERLTGAAHGQKLAEFRIISLSGDSVLRRTVDRPNCWLWDRHQNAYVFPDDNHIVVEYRSGGFKPIAQLKVFQLNPWKLKSVQEPHPAANIYSPVASHSGRLLSVGGSLIDVSSLQRVGDLLPHLKSQTAAFSPDDTRLALLPKTTKVLVHIWDPNTRRPLIELEPFQETPSNPEMRFSDDGRILALKGETMIELWLAPAEYPF